MSARMLHIRSGNDFQGIIFEDEVGRDKLLNIGPRSEFVVTLRFDRGLPFFGITRIDEDGYAVTYNIELDNVRIDSNGPMDSKMFLRGKDDKSVEFDILSDLCCAYDFELILSTAKLVHDHMLTRQ